MVSPVVSSLQPPFNSAQISQDPTSFGVCISSASSSGRSVVSDNCSASSRGGPVRHIQKSPSAALARSSRLCDPDDESVLEVD
jgi:hypothetical protein